MDSIPEQLERVLWKVSQRIPICIVSSKDFHFISRRAKFARVLACILGIETIVLRKCSKEAPNEIEKRSIWDNLNCVKEHYLLPNIEKTLNINSILLSKLVENIELEFKDIVMVERKHTSDRKHLAGITIDYRHLNDWMLYKNKLEPSLDEIIQKYRSSSLSKSDIYVQTYRSHPFLDVYAVYCDNGMALDLNAAYILNSKDKGETNILYLGDSENDNPAFRKASISVGIISDKRLSPKLDCPYLIEYKHLSEFLGHLVDEKFVFSERLLNL